MPTTSEAQGNAPTRIVKCAYSYYGFKPLNGVEDFERAVGLRRELWQALAGIHEAYLVKRDALYAEDESFRAAAAAQYANEKARRAALREAREAVREAPAFSALLKWRSEQFRDAKRVIAAKGLNWCDYNAVVFQFQGAARASASRGAKPYRFATACGEAVVMQIRKTPAAALTANKSARVTYLGKQNGHRHMQARLDMRIRGPENPLGEATLSLNFALYRPLPPAAPIAEVRVMRFYRDAVFENTHQHLPRWRVSFVVERNIEVREPRNFCALVFDWVQDVEEPYSNQRLAALYDANGTRTILMEAGDAEDWQFLAAHKERLAQLEASDAQDFLSRRLWLRSLEARLIRRRRQTHRALAARLAAKYDVLVLQKINLAQKGVKGHTGPAELRLALRWAFEAAGGHVVEIHAARGLVEGPHTPAENLARQLYKAARGLDLSAHGAQKSQALKAITA